MNAVMDLLIVPLIAHVWILKEAIAVSAQKAILVMEDEMVTDVEVCYGNNVCISSGSLKGLQAQYHIICMPLFMHTLLSNIIS